MKPTLDRSRSPLLVARFFPTITREEACRHFEEIAEAAEQIGRVGVVVDLSDAPIASALLRKSAAADMRALFRRSGARFVAVAHVARTRVGRTLLGVVQSLAPPPFPSAVTSTFAEATSWVEAQLERDELVRASRAEESRAPDARAATGLARTLVAAARAAGIDTGAELAAVGLSNAELASVDGYVAYRKLMTLVDAFAERTGDAAFGLHTAERFVDASSFGVVGFAARSSTTLREAIDRTVRYAALMNENTQLSVAYDDAGARVVDGPMPPLVWPSQYAELAIASFVTLGRAWTGVPFAARAAGFRHPAPPSAREHARVLGCRPSFGGRENYVVIPRDVLDARLRHGDRLLGEFFDAKLDELARSLVVAPGPLIATRDALRALLSEGQSPTVATTAKRCGASERTLQRRLTERGVSFSEMLDSVRREIALRAIETTSASVQELAQACGFSDVKAFRRAFRRWTGVAPGKYRGAPHT